jgi:hypothetical protein
MSLRIDSRKNRSSSTTDTSDVFGIGFRQFARTAMRMAPNNVAASTCEFRNVRKDNAGAMPVARKLWLMPGAELSKLRAKTLTEQCHRA